MFPALAIVLFFIVFGVPAGLVLVPWAAVTRRADTLYRVGTWVARNGLRVGGIRVVIEGRENVPTDRAAIILSNHVSNLDPPVLVPAIPQRTVVFLKRSLMKIPILGTGMRIGGFIPVDRRGSVEAAKLSVSMAAEQLARGLHVTVFVEGTRSRTGKLLPFKKGPFFLAMDTGAPCVPVSIYGTESLMKKGSFKIQPGVVHVKFHAPRWPRDFASRDELMAAVRDDVASGLPEWMRS